MASLLAPKLAHIVREMVFPRIHCGLTVFDPNPLDECQQSVAKTGLVFYSGIGDKFFQYGVVNNYEVIRGSYLCLIH